MKSASTQARTEYILFDICNGSRSKPLARLKEYDDDLTWKTLSDVKSLSFEKSNNNKEYGTFKLVPPANSMSCEMDNKEEKYSPDTGNEFDGVLIRNRKIKAEIGYQLNDTTTETYNFTESDSSIEYHTQVISDKIYNDSTSEDSFTNLPGITDSWTFYDGVNYGSGTYMPEGYYLSSVLDFFIYDTETLQQFLITSDTTDIQVYYRASNNQEDLTNNLTSFTLLGSTVVGIKTFTLADITERWFQFALVFSTATWSSTSGYATDIQIKYLQSAEYFTQGEYLMDNPGFHNVYGDYSASFSARDYLKKAFETEVTCPSYTSATDCATILTDVCTRAGIPHNDGSETIPATTYTVSIADSDNFINEKAIDIFDEVMLYLNSKDSTYRLEVINGNLTLYKATQSTSTADWVLDYRYNLLTVDKRYESDKLLQRVTVVTKDHLTNTEQLLKSQAYVAAATDIDLAWASSAGADAMFLRIVVTGTGTFTLNEVDLENWLINFDLSGDTVNLTVNIYGGYLASGFTGKFGESISYDNQSAYDGFTQKIVNRLCQSDAECKALAEGLITKYGNPNYNITATIPCNPLLEIGDNLLLWEKYSNTASILQIDNISISYDASGAKLYQTLQLTDTGFDYTDFIWSRNGATPGANDMIFSTGFVWSQDLGVSVTSDPNTYSELVPVTFT